MVELADSPPTSSNTSESSESPPTTMIDHPFMTALISYPILSVVASHLDQTDLSNLSSTCRRAYHILRDHRRTLQNISLKCFNEAAIVTTASPKLVSIGAPGRGLVGGVMATRCARDLVRLCFSCGIPICRNCIRKPHCFHVRLRLLCPPCQDDPSLLPLHSDTMSAWNAALYGFPAICKCDTDGWVCAKCEAGMVAENEKYFEWMHLHNGTSRGMRIHFLRCYRGWDECAGISDEDRANDDDMQVETQDEYSDDRSWEDMLAEVIESTGDSAWERTMDLVTSPKQRSRPHKRLGKILPYPLTFPPRYEWKGEVRSWCGWCDRVSLSKQEKAATGWD